MTHICKFSFKMLTLLCLLVIPSHLLAVDVPLYLEKYNFTKGSNRPLLTSGWSAAEQTHTWSDGDSATITFTLNPPPVIDFDLILDATAFLFGTHLRQEVDVQINENAAETLVYTPEANDNKTFKLPKAWVPDGIVRLLFNFKNPMAPAAVSSNSDPRPLGLALRTLYVSTPNIENTFQGVVTLGDNCYPRVQIGHYFRGKHSNNERIYTGGGNFFDAMVPRNLKLLADAIENRLENCATSSMVVKEIFWEKGRIPPLFTSVDETYDMHFNHLFDRHPAVMGHFNLTQPLFNKHYPDLLPKIDYLKNKFLLNKNRALYVVCGPSASDERLFNQENVIKLKMAISSMRGDINFTLLVLSLKKLCFHNRDNIIFRTITPRSDFNVLDPDFQKILDEFTFLPCPPKEASGHE